MFNYLQLLSRIVDSGTFKSDRTGTGTWSRFGEQLRFDLKKGFPLVTAKYTPFKTIAHELLWFLRGSTNVKPLQDVGVHIWDEWAERNGDLGPVYGKQWRSWNAVAPFGAPYTIDQIKKVIDTLRTNPNDRRMIVSAWNVAELGEMRLPPCHLLFQFYTRPLREEERAQWLCRLFPNLNLDKAIAHLSKFQYAVPTLGLSCQIYQRSCDMFLGVPFNIASYALLTHMIAEVTDMAVDELIWVGGDCHVYSNHREQVKEILKRDPLPLPELFLSPLSDIDRFEIDDFRLEGYQHHPAIKADVAV